MEQKNRASSLDNALSVLDLFTLEDSEWRIKDIAEQLGVAQGTAHRLVTTLVSEGFLTKDPLSHTYRLGTSILALGSVVHSRNVLHRMSLPILEKLRNQCQETVHLAVLKNLESTYLSKIDSSHPVRLLSHVGKQNPAHCTSSGQVLMAFQPSAMIEQFLERKLEKYTSRTITEPEALRQLLIKIRQQGFAISVEEYHDGVSSVSAPVKNPQGYAIACVTVAGPIQRIHQGTIPKITKWVVLAAEEITRHVMKANKKS
ncbi:IclR family transcriptional regulator [Ammoniphilus sp. YIM 78166]|uniref:IclR family transcriptional regulator n=1 Tax=Ammoniphilus sp. YIM 78166 TaxID=1644106 RepID=UPI00106F9AF5|nr:IclR family transcriptional regulator [Ammoniphilus sp. YIM 78166]